MLRRSYPGHSTAPLVFLLVAALAFMLLLVATATAGVGKAQGQPLATATIVATGSPSATATPGAPGQTGTQTATAMPTAMPTAPCSAEWKVVPVPGAGVLRDVAAISPDDVWVVGDNRTLHWDGASWAEVPTLDGISFTRISAVDGDDVWATNGYDVLHWDGTAWSDEYDPPVKPERGGYSDLVAIAADDVWLVGTQWPASDYRQSTYATHWDGEEWTVANGPSSGTQGNGLIAVSGIPGGHVWATGYWIGSLLLRWTGTDWAGDNPEDNYNHTASMLDVEVVAPDDAWVVGFEADRSHFVPTAIFHYDGAQWHRMAASDMGGLYSVSAAAPEDVWAVGEQGTVHWDGSAWSQVPAPAGALTAVDAIGPEDAWAIGADVVLHYSKDPFWDVPQNSPFYSYVRCLACRGIVSGYSDASFRPNERVTRGQAAKIVSNAAGYSDDIPSTKQTFEDVSPDSPFWVYIERVYAHGAISGYSCGPEAEPCPGAYYRPGAYLTRGQLAKIAANVAGYSETPTGQTFNDVRPDDPFYTFIERAAAHNVISGYPCGGINPDTGEAEPCPGAYFRPGSTITRGQTAKIVAGALMPDCDIPARSQPPVK